MAANQCAVCRVFHNLEIKAIFHFFPSEVFSGEIPGAAKSWTQLSNYHKDPLLSLPLCKDVYSNPCVCVCVCVSACGHSHSHTGSEFLGRS